MTDITVPLKIDPITITPTGSVTIPAPASGDVSTQRGFDAVRDLGMDATGVADCAAVLAEYLASDSGSVELHFPPGKYRFNSTVVSNAKSACLLGDGALQNMGDSPVIFFSDQKLEAILWWNRNSTSANMNGPRIEGIQFQDRSSNHDQLRCAVRLEACANSELRIGLLNLRPRRYSDGTVSVSTNSRTVTGAGTQWSADMSPGWIVIAGYPYEIVSVDSATRLTLAIDYQGPSVSMSSYAINWGGTGVIVDPGCDFTQYGKDWSLNGRCGCALFAMAGATSPKYTGTSRIKIKSGYLNGEGMPDSMACYLGPYSDTFIFDVAMNSYAFCVVVANGHQHDLQHLDCENAGGPPPVTGKPVEYGSCHGILVMSSNSSDTWGNRIGGYFRQIGTGIELYGTAGRAPTWTVFSACTFRSNKVNYVPGNATNTGGLIPAGTTYEDGVWQRFCAWLRRLVYRS